MSLNDIINLIEDYVSEHSIRFLSDDRQLGIAPNGQKSKLPNDVWNYVHSYKFQKDNGDWTIFESSIILDENMEPALFERITDGVYARVYSVTEATGFIKDVNSKMLSMSECDENISKDLTRSYDQIRINESDFVLINDQHKRHSNLIKDVDVLTTEELVSYIFKDLQLLEDNSMIFEALRGEIIEPEELRDLLRQKTVFFQYKKKKTGQIRRARGTLNLNKVPIEQHPLGIAPSNPELTVTYYDFDRRDWRSVSKNPNQVIVLSGRMKREPKVFITNEPKDVSGVKVVDTPDGKDTIQIIDRPDQTDEPTNVVDPDVDQVSTPEPEPDPIPDPDIPKGDDVPTQEPEEPEEPVKPTPKPTMFDKTKKEQRKVIRQKKAENKDQMSMFDDYDSETGAIKVKTTIRKSAKKQNNPDPLVDKQQTLDLFNQETNEDPEPQPYPVDITPNPDGGNIVKAKAKLIKR